MHQGGRKTCLQLSRFHQADFGENRLPWNELAFMGGVLVLFDSRLTVECTSGHMMSDERSCVCCCNSHRYFVDAEGFSPDESHVAGCN